MCNPVSYPFPILGAGRQSSHATIIVGAVVNVQGLGSSQGSGFGQRVRGVWTLRQPTASTSPGVARGAMCTAKAKGSSGLPRDPHFKAESPYRKCGRNRRSNTVSQCVWVLVEKGTRHPASVSHHTNHWFCVQEQPHVGPIPRRPLRSLSRHITGAQSAALVHSMQVRCIAQALLTHRY